jgi:DNA-binding MurR/RpiR family transcriptional regulator
MSNTQHPFNNSTPAILLEIIRRLPQMSEGQKKISRLYLKGDLVELSMLSIGEVAARSMVSISMVTRFVKFLGYNNFKAFQITLAQSIRNREGNDPIFGQITKEDDNKSICEKVFYSNIKGLQDSLTLLDFDALSLAAAKIIQADKIIFLGLGRSYVAAYAAKLRFFRLGLNCVDYPGSHEQIIAASLASSTDIVFGISASGHSSSLVHSLELAHSMGATTVAVTSHPDSPITEVADIKLYTASSLELSNLDSYSKEQSVSTIVQMAVLDSLYMIVSTRIIDIAVRNLKISGEALDQNEKKI